MKLNSSMRTAKGQQREITLNFNRLKHTSHILLMCCYFYYYVRRSVLFKIHAANIEASKLFFFFFFLSVMEIYS